MIGTANSFAHQQKSETTYLDVAANDHGHEKALLVHRALSRVADADPDVIEIGPGGGAAVSFLASQLEAEPRNVRLTLIEAPGVTSHSLTQAIDRFNTVGACALVHGWAQDIATLVSEPVDVISASALLHEVYSYGGAYSTTRRDFPHAPSPERGNGKTPGVSPSTPRTPGGVLACGVLRRAGFGFPILEPCPEVPAGSRRVMCGNPVSLAKYVVPQA